MRLFHASLDSLLRQEKVSPGTRHSARGLVPGLWECLVVRTLEWEGSRSLPFTPEAGGPLRRGKFLSVGALSSLSGLWVPCMAIAASSVPGCEEWIHAP